MKETEWKIIDWAAERGIYDQSNVDKQLHKLVSEVGELADAILNDNMAQTVDGIGDCLVVLTNLAHMIGSDLETCYLTAWSEIKGRKGKMVNGAFVKESKKTRFIKTKDLDEKFKEASLQFFAELNLHNGDIGELK